MDKLAKEYKCDRDSDTEDIDCKFRKGDDKRMGLFKKASDRVNISLSVACLCLKLEYSWSDRRFRDLTLPIFVADELEMIKTCTLGIVTMFLGIPFFCPPPQFVERSEY